MRYCVYVPGMCRLSINGPFKTHDKKGGAHVMEFDQPMNLSRAGATVWKTRAEHQAQAP